MVSMLKLFANVFWRYTPGFFQKYFSMLFSGIFKHSFSRFFISPYCLFFGLSSEYLDLFESEKGTSSYFSYSDFFKRKYKNPPPMAGDVIWPCEGYVCDWGSFSDKNFSKVKGQNLDLNTIFNSKSEKTRTYFFTNIFLQISRECLNGGTVKVGQEIAKFDLGSTVCLASPSKIQVNHFLETVSVGQKIDLTNEEGKDERYFRKNK